MSLFYMAFVNFTWLLSIYLYLIAYKSISLISFSHVHLFPIHSDLDTHMLGRKHGEIKEGGVENFFPVELQGSGQADSGWAAVHSPCGSGGLLAMGIYGTPDH